MAAYRIADLIWDIRPVYDYTRNMLEPYRTDAAASDAAVSVCANDPEEENTAILRAVHTQLLSRFDGLMLHGAALVYGGRAYVFAAPSGTGKTTHLRLWKQCFGDDVWILNGDKPFLRLQEDGVMVYGGPWKGKERWGRNASCALGGIYLLHRGQQNVIRPASTQEALRELLQATFLPEDFPGKVKTLTILEALCRRVPISVLHCDMEPDAAAAVRRHIDNGVSE